MSEALTKMDQLFPEARKRNHYARPGHVSFDERSHKLITLAVESFGRLGREGSEFIDKREGADADGVGLSHRYRAGNHKSWKKEGK